MASDAVSHLGQPLQDPAVSEDLEAIFGRSAPALSRPARPRAAGVARAPHGEETHPPRRLSAASLGALAAAALAGIAAGSLLVKSPAPTPAKASSHPAALPVEMAAPIETPQASDAALAAAAAPPMETRAPPLVRARTVRHKAAAAPHSYAQVVAADRRLRAAYGAAIRAGAPRAVLISDRDRWASLRRRAAHDPVRLVAGYNALARDLDRAAARNRARPVRTAIHGRFRPRFPAWWQ
jgi:hypothetical protein